MRIFSKTTFKTLALLAALGFVAFWLLSAPRPLTASDLPTHTGDVANGERLYHAAGCHSCHLPGPDAAGIDAALPAGGTPLKTPVGIFYPPNLTPDPETGLGSYGAEQIKAALKNGTRMNGLKVAPPMSLFIPHISGLTDEDLDALVAYLGSLRPAKRTVPEPELTPEAQKLVSAP